jgi:hypothetical protein
LADAANTSADLAEIINHLLAPDTGGRFSTGVLRRTRRRGGTYQGPARHLGSAAEHSRRQMANWTCLARRGRRPARAAVR